MFYSFVLKNQTCQDLMHKTLFVYISSPPCNNILHHPQKCSSNH